MQHYDEARSLYLQGAAKGDASSMYSLGVLYAEGTGVSRNYAEAQLWYEKSAEKGNATALYSIGLLYLHDAPGPPARLRRGSPVVGKGCGTGIRSGTEIAGKRPILLLNTDTAWPVAMLSATARTVTGWLGQWG